MFKKNFLTFCLLLSLLFLNLSTVSAKDYVICSKSFFNKIETAHSSFIEAVKLTPVNSDALFYAYLKTFQHQVELMNKWNVENIQSANEKKISMLCSKNNLIVQSSEIGYSYVPDYEKILIQNKDFLTPQMISWLEYLKNNTQIVDDAALNIPIDKVRCNIISLESLIKNNPNFVANQDVIDALNMNAFIYITSFDNTPIFDAETKILVPEYKKSYQKFIEENKDSKYYDDIHRFYNLLELNDFKKIDNFEITYKYTLKSIIEEQPTITNSNPPKKKKSSVKVICSSAFDFLNDFFGISPATNNQLNENRILPTAIHKPTIQEQIEQAKAEQAKETLEYLQCVFDDYYNIYRASENEKILHPEMKNAIVAMDYDYSIMSKKVAEYSKNKNDMANNYKIYSDLKVFSEQYNEMIEGLENIYKKAYEDYKNGLDEKVDEIFSNYHSDNLSNNSGNERYYYKVVIKNQYKFENFKDEFYANDQTKGFEIIEKLKTTKDYFDAEASEIYNYSFNYEKNKTINYMKKNGKKLDGGDIATFIYIASYYNPTTSHIYDYNSVSHPLYICQVLKNGVMVRGNYTLGYNSTMANIFIQTNRKYAANQGLKRNTYYAYTGIMHYKTAFGVPNAVWKFRELSQTEVKNNFTVNYKLYFYNNS